MNPNKNISILFPSDESIQYQTISETACHDIGLDTICEQLTSKKDEQRMILSVMRLMTDRPEVSEFRIGVFSDIMSLPEMREKMLDLLGRIRFLNDYGSFKKEHDIKSGLWEFLHRLSELNDYIQCVEEIRECLKSYDIHSEGMLRLKDYMDAVYEASLFAELKEDIKNLNADAASLRSITLGINLTPSFEVASIGLISVNNKEFKNSAILTHFADALTTKNGIHEGNRWNGSYHFQPLSASQAEFTAGAERFGTFYSFMQQPLAGTNKAAATIANVPDADPGAYTTHYFDHEVSHLLSHLTRKLERILSRYVSLSIKDIVDLMPEFIYYVRWAKYIEKLKENGFSFCTAEVLSDPEGDIRMKAHNIYNLKLAVAAKIRAEEIITNDLDFSNEHTIYLLTGANRGGKTTITQAVGLLFVLAQGGISVPGESFAFLPADCIYTHYPADEDKTLDLGRLGEECQRFKEIYTACTETSLLLMNETFSTTSFEEGYFIARDAVKAILSQNIRTIYNTHMHKLAFRLEEYNLLSEKSKVASLVAESNDGIRSFKMKIAPPEGKSYAEDIAVKYGVTYESLIADKE